MIDIQKDTAVEGEEIEVNCTAMASKPATTIRWFKGNKELKGKVTLPWTEVFRSVPLWKLKTNANNAPETNIHLDMVSNQLLNESEAKA